jgi:hypothetical protein
VFQNKINEWITFEVQHLGKFWLISINNKRVCTIDSLAKYLQGQSLPK